MSHRAIVVMLALLAGCGSQPARSNSAFRRITRSDFCLTTQVFARPDEKSLVGFLQGEASVPAHEGTVDAVNVETTVDQTETSIWRNANEVLQWYVRNEPPPKPCRWYRPSKTYEPGSLEIPPGVRLWQLGPGQWTKTEQPAGRPAI